METYDNWSVRYFSFPLAYASKFHPEFDATLMPGTVKNHDHPLRFN